jgi:hypothetical protein
MNFSLLNRAGNSGDNPISVTYRLIDCVAHWMHNRRYRAQPPLLHPK